MLFPYSLLYWWLICLLTHLWKKYSFERELRVLQLSSWLFYSRMNTFVFWRSSVFPCNVQANLNMKKHGHLLYRFSRLHLLICIVFFGICIEDWLIIIHIILITIIKQGVQWTLQMIIRCFDNVDVPVLLRSSGI